jgi:hypothetical protein
VASDKESLMIALEPQGLDKELIEYFPF